MVIALLTISVIIFFAFWRHNSAKEAAITLDVPKNVHINEEINLPVKIDTVGQSINAAEVYLKFNPADLEVLAASKDNSIFSLWIKDQPAFSNEKGEVSFAGGLPNPGFAGSGQIGKIKVRPKKQGNIIIEFDSKSRALLNDGTGTEIKLKLDVISLKVGG